MAVLATAKWRVRPSGNNLNGGGYDPGLAGAGTDRSQQNAPFVTFNGSTVTASGTTATLTLTGVTGSAADIGNCLHIASGTNFTAGYYFITAATGSTWTLDRNPVSSGTGSALVGRMGGGWADFWTNTTSSGPLVPGNIVYILGSGTPNPASYTFDYTVSVSGFTSVNGNATAGMITYANDPSTPGYLAPPNTTGGMPCILGPSTNILFNNIQGVSIVGLWLVANSATNGSFGFVHFTTAATISSALFGVVFDQNAFDMGFCGGSSVNGPAAITSIVGCEAFSSVVAGSAGSNSIIYVQASDISGNNFHDTVGPGPFLTNIVAASNGCSFNNNIVAKCNGAGVSCLGSLAVVQNNTIDGNTGNGIDLTTQASLNLSSIRNNIISNHTGVGKFGLSVGAGATAANNRVAVFCDSNVYYNNTADLNNLSYGPHDTHGGSNPYVGQSTENYTLG